MTRIVLAALVLLNCTAFASEVFAQAGQTVNPVPITPPSINTTTLTCQINCDTQAMFCVNNCVPITGSAAQANPMAPAGVTRSAILKFESYQAALSSL
jgi:hypothetical protein